jgi:hypothetical protein
VRYFLNYVYRQYKLLVKIFIIKNNNSFSENQIDLIKEKGIRVEYSPLYKHNINGTIERTRGVLITHVIILKLNNRLPDNISAEYYITTRYFLNRILTRRIKYRTLIGRFLEKIGDTN